MQYVRLFFCLIVFGVLFWLSLIFTQNYPFSLKMIWVLFFVGAAFGSFSVATAWRLRFKQLSQDQQDGVKLTKEEKKEYSKLKKQFQKNSFFDDRKNLTKDRSVCLHCGRQLLWFDMIPVISWLILGGKCRFCRKPIGRIEFLAEIGLGALFVISYIFWPFGFYFNLDSWINIALGATWLIILILLTIHIIYDSKWMLLLDKITILIFIFVVLLTIFRFISGNLVFNQAYFMGLAGSIIILPLVYGILFFASKGNWIGFGDVKLLIPLALGLADFNLAVLVLFLANIFGLIWVIPGLIINKVDRKSRLAFVPFLILALICAILFGEFLMQSYFVILGV